MGIGPIPGMDPGGIQRQPPWVEWVRKRRHELDMVAMCARMEIDKHESRSADKAWGNRLAQSFTSCERVVNDVKWQRLMRCPSRLVEKERERAWSPLFDISQKSVQQLGSGLTHIRLAIPERDNRLTSASAGASFDQGFGENPGELIRFHTSSDVTKCAPPDHPTTTLTSAVSDNNNQQDETGARANTTMQMAVAASSHYGSHPAKHLSAHVAVVHSNSQCAMQYSISAAADRIRRPTITWLQIPLKRDVGLNREGTDARQRYHSTTTTNIRGAGRGSELSSRLCDACHSLAERPLDVAIITPSRKQKLVTCEEIGSVMAEARKGVPRKLSTDSLMQRCTEQGAKSRAGLRPVLSSKIREELRARDRRVTSFGDGSARHKRVWKEVRKEPKLLKTRRHGARLVQQQQQSLAKPIQQFIVKLLDYVGSSPSSRLCGRGCIFSWLH